MKRIYLAGPDVFYEDAFNRFEKKKSLCREYGFEGVSPLDAGVGDLENTHTKGVTIYIANEALIDSCDIVFANLVPWRGPELDVGTAVELGYARAKGKLLVGYTTDLRKHVVRVLDGQPSSAIATTDEGFHTLNGVLIDDFEMHDNLMVDGAIHQSGGTIFAHELEWKAFEAALKSLA